MATHICLSCDFPGDGNCSVCHGKGKTLPEVTPQIPGLSGQELSCPACGGSGHCEACGGSGEIEVGGESG